MSITSRFEVKNTPLYALIKFIGFVDASTVLSARPALQQEAPPSCVNFVVDLSEADFLDSHGVGLFVSLLKRAHANRGRIVFAGATGQPESVLQMVGFNGELVTYVESLAAAEELLA
ncbi:MAG TPA: STAS domain-containing protein [Patescibacteria group bacterium]|nr:STAS domain-containing protein [Patescibacteria group bacterium]